MSVPPCSYSSPKPANMRSHLRVCHADAGLAVRTCRQIPEGGARGGSAASCKRQRVDKLPAGKQYRVHMKPGATRSTGCPVPECPYATACAKSMRRHSQNMHGGIILVSAVAGMRVVAQNSADERDATRAAGAAAKEAGRREESETTTATRRSCTWSGAGNPPTCSIIGTGGCVAEMGVPL